MLREVSDDCLTPSLTHSGLTPPALHFLPSADSQYNTAIINTNVIVSYTGEITWLSHGMFKSACNISVEYFPFDIQDCRLKWASWTFDGFAVREC